MKQKFCIFLSAISVILLAVTVSALTIYDHDLSFDKEKARIAGITSTLQSAEEVLIGHYTFDNDPGGIAINEVNTPEALPNGRVSGWTTYVQGVGDEGSAICLNGIADYVVIPGTSDINLESGFRISAWVRYLQNPGENIVVGKRELGEEGGYSLGVFNNKASSFLDEKPALIAPYSSGDTEWHQVMTIYDGSTHSLFVDGKLVAKQERDYSSFNSADITIGALLGEDGYLKSAFEGFIDEVKIYKEAPKTKSFSPLILEILAVMGGFR